MALLNDFTPPHASFTLWLSGLPCAGKSTLSREIGHQLQRRRYRVEVLDADDLRLTLCKGLGFTRADRDENVARIGWICGTLNRHGVAAIAAVISPYRNARAGLRSSIPRFVEVFVKAPLSVCIERDVKGMYARALKGEIRHFTGIDDPYEDPPNPDIVVETDKYSIIECSNSVINWLTFKGLIEGDLPPSQSTG
jgi:adenylylsulfate kinase